MGLEAKAMTMDMGKNKNDKKKNENDDDKGPAPAARVLVPGVPMPKSVVPMEEDRGGSSQSSGKVKCRPSAWEVPHDHQKASGHRPPRRQKIHADKLLAFEARQSSPS